MGISVESPAQPLTLSEVAQASGIPKNTLRTWQRRYGLQGEDISEDGTACFGERTLTRLSLIQQAIEMGHPASTAVQAEGDALEELAWAAAGSRLDRAWRTVLSMDSRGLRQHGLEFEQEHGSEAFVFEFALPLLRRVGHGWALGQITVAHEHFASQVIEDLARSQQPVGPDAPVVVLAVMPGEWHELSLSLGARLLAGVGVRAAIVNEATDVQALAKSVRHCQAATVIAVRVAQDEDDFQQAVRELATAVKAEVDVIVAGNTKSFNDFEVLSSLKDLKTWAEQRFPR